MTTLVSSPADASAVTRPVRYRFLDALRGVALCGILFVNLKDLIVLADANVGPHLLWRIYDVAIQGRFVPIFSFLFGVSAWLLYSSSVRR